jgi:hypothetical protein
MTMTRDTKPTSAVMDREPGAANGRSSIGSVTAGFIQGLPHDLDGAGETVGEAMRSVSASVSAAPDENVLVGAALASGMAIGLLIGGGPRLLAAGMVITSVALGATLLGRRRNPARGRV